MLLTKADYARKKGWSKPYLSKLIREEKIPVTPSGKIDPAKADAALKKIRGGTMRSAHNGNGNSASRGFIVERVKSEKFNALIKELEYRRRIGELIEVAEVTKAAGSAFATVRTRLRSLPRSLAATLSSATPREAEQILQESLDAALDSLSTSLFEGENGKS